MNVIARMKRLYPDGSLQHLVQRVNKRQAMLCMGRGYGGLSAMAETWCREIRRRDSRPLIHVHLLETPFEEGAISRMMQHLGRVNVGRNLNANQSTRNLYSVPKQHQRLLILQSILTLLLSAFIVITLKIIRTSRHAEVFCLHASWCSRLCTNTGGMDSLFSVSAHGRTWLSCQ